MLGEKLAALRKRSGYSQQELAEKLSVTRQTISNWECGQGAPALDKAVELAKIYQISLDDLAGEQVEVVVKEKRESQARVLKRLVGKYVKIEDSDDAVDRTAGESKGAGSVKGLDTGGIYQIKRGELYKEGNGGQAD